MWREGPSSATHMAWRQGKPLAAATDRSYADLAEAGVANQCVESRTARDCMAQAAALVSMLILAMTKLFGWVAGRLHALSRPVSGVCHR